MTTSTTPTLWFGPPDITVDQANPAGQQFMSMFNDPAAWQVTAGASVGIILSEAFILSATDQQLQQIFTFLNQHHLQMAMVTEIVPVQANGVGNGQESFTSGPSLADALQRIKQLGGTLNMVAMDAPLMAGVVRTTGPQLSITALAQQVAPNVALIKSVFPNVQFEDGEAFGATNDLVQWTQAFQAATGSPIAQIDADVNWDATGVLSQLEVYAQAVQASGAVFGITGNATTSSTTNQSWALAAETNIAAALADPLISPSNIQVESWNPNPTVTLPEGLSGTLAHVAVETAETAPLYASGYLTGGKGITASTTVPTPSYVGSVLDAVRGAAVSVPGVALSVTAGSATGTTFAVVLTDVSGDLRASVSGTGTVSGNGTNVLLVCGSLATVNAELASLTYSGTAVGTDTIDVTTYDGAGLVDDHLITVAIAAPLAVSLPSTMTAASLYANIYGTAASPAVLAVVQAAMAAGMTLAQAASAWIAQGQSTISALVEQVQGASATPAAIASLTAALVDGATLAQIRASLAGAASVQAELGAAYQSHYGKAPTAAQLAALTQQLAAGASLQTVEVPLLANSQAETQITTLFQQVEGQAPDASDLLTDARALLKGTTLSSIRAQLANSATVQANLSALFQHIYDLPPTTAQLTSLTAQLAGSTTYAQIQAQFTAVAQGIVIATYKSILNRSPTASELASYTNWLGMGVLEPGTIRDQLAYSAESTTNLTTMYQQVIGQAAPQSMITTLGQCLAIGEIPLPQLKVDLATAATLYHQITGQPVTAAALSPLMYDFLCTATPASLSYAIAHSAQVTQSIVSSYQTLFGNSITGAQLTALESSLQAGTTTMAAVQSSLVAQAAADVPVLSDVVATQYDPANTWDEALGAISLSDPDPLAVETVTVTVTGGDGQLNDWGAFTNATHTVFSRTASASLLQGDLRAIELEDQVAGKTATLNVTVQNGAGHSTSATVKITTGALSLAPTTHFVFMPAVSDTVAGGGLETFMFPAAGFAQDSITNFNLAHDIIQLPKAMVASFAALQAHETASGGGTMVAFGQSESIFLPGIAPSSLHSSNFQFV